MRSKCFSIYGDGLDLDMVVGAVLMQWQGGWPLAHAHERALGPLLRLAQFHRCHAHDEAGDDIRASRRS